MFLLSSLRLIYLIGLSFFSPRQIKNFLISLVGRLLLSFFIEICACMTDTVFSHFYGLTQKARRRCWWRWWLPQWRWRCRPSPPETKSLSPLPFFLFPYIPSSSFFFPAINSFPSGILYWEIDVGIHDTWCGWLARGKQSHCRLLPMLRSWCPALYSLFQTTYNNKNRYINLRGLHR